MSKRLQRVLLTGDDYGVRELLRFVSSDCVAAIVAAGNRPQYHPVLEDIARSNGIPMIIQPRRSNEGELEDFLRQIGELDPDGLVCHSYSMILPPELLNMLNGYAFNLHAALLPRNRGPNPVQWALIHGDAETGVTLHQMEERLDAGPIVDQIAIPVHDEDTWVTLMERVRDASSVLLERTLPSILDGKWRAWPQDESQAVRNPRISKKSFRINFEQMSDRDIFNLIRAQVAPLAGAYIESDEGRIHFTAWMSMNEIQALRARYG